ncbi:hypothetical protein [Usitatibacter palustris]|uniref:DUF4124 domain-containing protein n=1 Tax=Usitatibacter palustris TaxID=2732487 RepID=A0A6M4H3F3_9PROT|nr:hypothetical protein [Usitatibacter palustris]QJR14109.1 hypothetical protein DSM104440_00902 [Usitatibacter palustris]
MSLSNYFRVAAFAALAGACTAWAQEPKSDREYLCVDDHETRMIQKEPCTSKPVSKTNVPLRASAISEANAKETIRRHDIAMSSKDPLTAVTFLSKEVQVELISASRPRQILDRKKWSDILVNALHAVDHYKVERNCKATETYLTDMALQCDSTEKWKILERSGTEKANSTIDVVIEDGYVRIKKLKSYSSW